MKVRVSDDCAPVERSLTSSLVAAAIVTVFEAALAGKTATGREGYYFAGL